MAQSNQSHEFSRIIESLLAQNFICQYADPPAFEYLSKETYHRHVDEFLQKIGRCLRQTDDQGAYYCAYLHIDSQSTRKQLSQQFRQTINILEPMVRWLSLCMSATQRDAPISAGEVIRQGEILSALENAPALVDDLALITRSGVFSTKKDRPSDQLSHVLMCLCEQGYLLSSGSSSSIYTATGKWSYLFEVLEFIHTHEEIGVDDEPSGEHQEMLSL